MDFLRRNLPEFAKALIRFLYYPQERKKIFREIQIKRQQNTTILKYNLSARKLILFLVEGVDYHTGIDKISGGIISIVSLYEETRNLKEVHHSEVVLSTFPNHHLLSCFSQFDNTSDVFRFEQIISSFNQVEEILVHLPEYMCKDFLKLMRQDNIFKKLRSLKRVHLNIMNQNIRLMPSETIVSELKSHVNKITISTAHLKYCTPKLQTQYQVPVHLLSVWISPEKYTFNKYTEKENLIIVSPDYATVKESILKKIKTIPTLKVQVIKDITYEEYKRAIARAKWAITFGEGFDGYFIESIFSGAISFATYNQDFFPDDFADIDTVYQSDELMENTIVSHLNHFDNPLVFEQYQNRLYDLCCKYYSHTRYVQLLKDFYNGSYTYS